MHTADIWARLHQTLHSCSIQHQKQKIKNNKQPTKSLLNLTVSQETKNEKLPSQQLLGICVMMFCLLACFSFFYFMHFQYIYVLLSTLFHHSLPSQCSKSLYSHLLMEQASYSNMPKELATGKKSFEGHQQLLLRLLFYS